MTRAFHILACLLLCTGLAIAADDAPGNSDDAEPRPNASTAQAQSDPSGADEAQAGEADADRTSDDNAEAPAAPDPASKVDPAEVQRLIDQLGADEFSKRQAATEALKAIGAPAKAALQRVVQADDAEARLRARVVLQSIRLRELRRGIGEADRELHIVGAYEGSYPPGVGHGGGNHPQGSATVIVNRPGKAVTLVLTAYEPIGWKLQPSENTFIERVILSGYHPQSITARPEGTKVADRSRRPGGARGYFFAYKKDNRYQKVLDAVGELTDLPVASFQGAYKLNAPVKVDAPPADEPDGEADRNASRDKPAR